MMDNFFQILSDRALWGALVFYFAGFFLALIFAINKNLSRPWILRLILICAAAMNLAGWLLRWQASYDLGFAYAPLTNVYESLIFCALSAGALTTFLSFRFIHWAALYSIVPFVLLALAGLETKGLAPIIPALKSNWLLAHVSFCFLAYGAFFIAAIFGLAMIIKKDSAEVKKAQNILGGLLVFGFITLTLGIIFGAIWAERAWGRFWGWDPKETWSLITWAIYALTLHLKNRSNFSGRTLGFLALVGFFLVLFTYFGVGRWLAGLHSYGIT